MAPLTNLARDTNRGGHTTAPDRSCPGLVPFQLQTPSSIYQEASRKLRPCPPRPRMAGSERTTNTHSPLTAERFFLSRVEKCLHHGRVFVQQVVFPIVSIVAYETDQKHQRVLHKHENPRGRENSLQISPTPSSASTVRTGGATRNILSGLLHLAGCPQQELKCRRTLP